MPAQTHRKLRIAFLHPDLGIGELFIHIQRVILSHSTQPDTHLCLYFSCIGGAERLVVDAALCLQRFGHTVHMYTSHHDKNHCFEETRDGMSIFALCMLLRTQYSHLMEL